MSEMNEETSPQRCAAEGLSCENCVKNKAEMIQTLCGTLVPAQAESMFFQIYRASGCAPMAPVFVAAISAAKVNQTVSRSAAVPQQLALPLAPVINIAAWRKPCAAETSLPAQSVTALKEVADVIGAASA
jgi:hypothetical protein